VLIKAQWTALALIDAPQVMRTFIGMFCQIIDITAVMQFNIDPISVSHERMQDEVIVINLASGAYYSGSGTAADLWTLLAAGVTADGISATLAPLYAADLSQVSREVNDCLKLLVDRQVITPGAGKTEPATELPPMQRGAWAPPVFDEYTDMWDLLQADPIHDVGEAGWPYAMSQKP
jgi:hypothetical protein